MSSLASRRLTGNCASEGSNPDLTKLEISNVSDMKHSTREEMTSSDEDYCDNIVRAGAETAPVISESESSLKRYSID